MSLLTTLLSFVIHLDAHLTALIASVGIYTYGILFLIILAETGLVIAPFLPGDSLLFACGVLAARGLLDMYILLPLLWIASVCGDSLNYAVGQWLGPKMFRKDSRFLNHDHLELSRDFFRRHGGKSIIMARFLPVVRTFAPLVAGMSHMSYGWFFFYNVVGGALWVAIFSLIGFFFGQIPAVQEHLTLAIIVLIIVSSLPAAYHWAKHHWSKRKA